MFINREDYVDMVRPFYETDLIKVITGIRRSGKSIILQAIRDEFLHNGINGDQIIYINLEDFEYEFIKTAADLYEGIIKKDIAGKSSKFEKKTFMDISLYILANAGKEFSSENVINYYKTHHKKSITRQTVYNYLEKMQKAFLVHGVKKYNIVGKEALKANEKYYAVDMGLRIINTNSINFEDTFFLENVIYNELILRGYTVYTGKTYKGEIDFVAIKDGKKCFIQVCYLLASAETIAREFGAFKPISDASPKYVMSLDKIDMSRDGIGHINIVDFLLRKVDIALT